MPLQVDRSSHSLLLNTSAFPDYILGHLKILIVKMCFAVNHLWGLELVYFSSHNERQLEKRLHHNVKNVSALCGLKVFSTMNHIQ
jgi:hypothetical protein